MNDQEITNVDQAQVARNLHFVIDNGHGLKCRPAMVVEDWPDSGRTGYVNLVVFPDGTNDGKYGTDDHGHRVGPFRSSEEGNRITADFPDKTDRANVPLLTRWETSVLPNHAVRAHRTWHWPRECQHMNAPEASYVDKSGQKNHHNHAEGFIDTHNCYACTVRKNEQEA